MSNKKHIALLVAVMTGILCACGVSDKGDNMVADTDLISENAGNENVETVNGTETETVNGTISGTSDTGAAAEMSEEEMSRFASGISSDAPADGTDNNSTNASADGSNSNSGEGSDDGSSTSEDTIVNENSATGDFVLNNEIEETCPSWASMRRADVDYSDFIHVTYYSETCKMDRGCCILLPADYSEDKQYPVLYLLHGIFGNEYSLPNDTNVRIKEIAANMAADGFTDETIVVCPNMYATDDPEQQPGFTAEAVLPYDNFINDLVVDLMPYIESNYSVLTGRENTYLAGFSMGGRETIYITLQRPELFGYVCAISAAPGVVPATDGFMTHEGQISEEEMKFADDAVIPNVFIICCGTKDSVVGTFPKSYHELLEANGAEHIWYEIPGADHDDNAIKSGLYNLFKQIAYDKADAE